MICLACGGVSYKLWVDVGVVALHGFLICLVLGVRCVLVFGFEPNAVFLFRKIFWLLWLGIVGFELLELPPFLLFNGICPAPMLSLFLLQDTMPIAQILTKLLTPTIFCFHRRECVRLSTRRICCFEPKREA